MLNIYVCVGSACHLKGSYDIINRLQRLIAEKQLEEKVVVKAALCLGRCTGAVSARVNEDEFVSLSGENVEGFIDSIVEKLESGSS